METTVKEVETPWGIVEQEFVPSAWGRFGFSPTEATDQQKQVSLGLIGVIKMPEAIASAANSRLGHLLGWIAATVGGEDTRKNGVRFDTGVDRFGMPYALPRLYVDGVDVTNQIDLVERREHISSWRSKATGKFNVTVGDYGARKTFPERKNGSHNYQAIGAELISYAARVNRRKAAERQTRSNETAVADIRAEFGLKNYGAVQASSDPEKPIKFKWSVDRAMTADETRRLMKALGELGLAPTY